MKSRTCTLLSTLAVLAGMHSARAEWKPADGPLMTRWAKQVTPENTWREYPRPQMVRKDWTNLNGLWNYAITGKEVKRPTQWDGKILVPFCVESALSGVMKPVKPDQALWYRRTFPRPVLKSGKRMLLHFGAVDWHATVWVNGFKVGEHKGGYDPFSFDITDAIGTTKSTHDAITVRVWDPTNEGFQPRGKQVLKPRGIWYTAVTGIWQTVWLEPVPRWRISGLKLTPGVDRSRLLVELDKATLSRSSQVDVIVSDNGREVARASGFDRVEVKLPNPKLWSPSDPHLYDLRVDLRRVDDATKVDDSVESYFGMRKIEMRKDDAGVNRLFLNGAPLFQFGPLDQGWWPDGLYTAPCDAALKHDIEVTKKFGMNMCRKHVKVEHARFYHWADKLGLLIWQDMPSGDKYIGRKDPDITRTPESAENFERELKAMLDAFGNHPSIVMWVPYNEGWGQWDTARICELIKKRDPSRLVNNASGWTDRKTGDVLDVHRYPGPGSAPLEENRAVVLGEFGGLGLQVDGHMWKKDKNWGTRSFKDAESLTAAYVGLLRKLRPLIGDGLAAAVYTQTSDVEIEVNGLMTYDREIVKIDTARAAAAARKLHLPPPKVSTLAPSSRVSPQTWSYTTGKPGEGWEKPAFDDSAWKTGPGGFGTEGTPGAVVRTEWKTPDIWLRRTFNLAELPQAGDDVQLSIHHDEDAEVYINGVPAAQFKGFTSVYATEGISPKARQSLRKGDNAMAIHCHQTSGGQYIDAGLVRVQEE